MVYKPEWRNLKPDKYLKWVTVEEDETWVSISFRIFKKGNSEERRRSHK